MEFLLLNVLQARSQGGGWRQGGTLPPGNNVKINKIITFQAISLVHCELTNVTL